MLVLHDTDFFSSSLLGSLDAFLTRCHMSHDTGIPVSHDTGIPVSQADAEPAAESEDIELGADGAG